MNDANSIFVPRDGFLTLEVVSQGQTPKDLREALSAGQSMSKDAATVLSDNAFVPTIGTRSILGLILGTEFDEALRLTRNVRNNACTRNWSEPCLEPSALALSHVTSAEMRRLGLWFLTTMHKAIKDPRDHTHLLTRSVGSGMCTMPDIPTGGWFPTQAFLFLIE